MPIKPFFVAAILVLGIAFAFVARVFIVPEKPPANAMPDREALLIPGATITFAKPEAFVFTSDGVWHHLPEGNPDAHPRVTADANSFALKVVEVTKTHVRGRYKAKVGVSPYHEGLSEFFVFNRSTLEEPGRFLVHPPIEERRER